MSCYVVNRALLLVMFSGLSLTIFAENRIDTQRPDAPDLAAYGEYAIGVKTFKIVNPKQIDIVKIDPANSTNPPKYDRPLTLETWYPAIKDSQGNTSLDVYLRDGKTIVSIQGKAIRDAKPFISSQKYHIEMSMSFLRLIV